MPLEINLYKLGTNIWDENLIALLDKDFFEFAANGQTYTRADIIQDIKEKKNSDEARELLPSDTLLKLLGHNLFLLTYRLVIRSESVEKTSLRSSIWSKGDGNWKLVFHQATAVI